MSPPPAQAEADRRRRIVLRSLYGVTLLGLALRLYLAWRWNHSLPNTPARLIGDEPGYDNLARGILHGQGFTWPGRVPLYPLWLAGIYFFAGESYNAVTYVQAVLGTSVIPLTYLLGARLFDAPTGLIAASLAAVSFVLFSQSLHLYSEILFTPLVLVVVITWWDALHKPSLWRFGWAGSWVGVSDLVRPTLLLFPLVAVLIVPYRRRLLRHGLAYLLGVTLVIAPWVVRNYVRHQAVFPLQTSGAFLWQGSPDYYHLIRDRGYTYLRIWHEVLRGSEWARTHDPTSVEGDRWWTRRALRSIAAEPLVYLRYAGEKLATYWIGDPNADWNDTYVFNYRALRAVGYTRWDAVQLMAARALPIVALLAVFVVRSRWRRLLPVYALLLYVTLLHALTHAEARLSDPFQPILLVLIGGALVTLWEKSRVSWKRRRHGAPSSPS